MKLSCYVLAITMYRNVGSQVSQPKECRKQLHAHKLLHILKSFGSKSHRCPARGLDHQHSSVQEMESCSV